MVSSSEATPTEQFLKLSQEQHRIQHSGDYANPKWFIPNTLKYYVLLHDMSEGDEQRYVVSLHHLRPSLCRWTILAWVFFFDVCWLPCLVSRAEADYEDIKQRYGSQVCYLLKINSRTSAPEDGEQIPDPWSKYLLRNEPHQVSAAFVPLQSDGRRKAKCRFNCSDTVKVAVGVVARGCQEPSWL